MRKRVLSILLVAAVAMALCVPAFAEESSTKEIKSSGGTADVELVGTIAVTNISVTVPGKVTFNLDPTKTAEATDTQVSGPGNLTITNNSLVPVYAAVNNVAVMQSGSNDITKDATLVTAASSLNDKTTANLMFALKADDETVSFETATDWMEAKEYKAPNVYVLRASDNGKIEPSGTMTLKIHAQANLGWAKGDKFGVSPTILISADKKFGEPNSDKP